ncbi:hypothetical protein Q5P01_001885 [Channa striata]|uniref:Uncharacterized protein n=1 Tax=Channa striata TaxID=64152 RepID=A0AA88T4B5_CHASR|nr:hypothetical protein Q5P01_001885 [Channa striata]
MSNTRLQTFRNFLTERFTAVAVEIFGEVETMAEEFYEENKRLRNVLHMVLNPEIKLSRIDVDQYTGATADIREQPPEVNTWVTKEISEPLPKKPKEEPIECDISWESEQEAVGAGNLTIQNWVKTDPDEDGNDVKMHCINELFHIQVVEGSPNFSNTHSTEEENHEHEDNSFLDSDTATDSLTLCRSEKSRTESQESQKPNTSMKKKSKPCLQKTKLELPRMMLEKSVIDLPDYKTLARLTEAFKDLPDDKKPLISKMDLTPDVELVDCAFGKVPKGCPMSYQCPVPSSKDYVTHDDAPPRPQLPLSDNMLETVLASPLLNPKEQEHANVIQITWEEAHSLEQSTRKDKELVDDLRKLRLTCHFQEICKIKQGQSHAAQLISKLRKGVSKCKTAKIEEEMRAEVLREYCENLCVNWSPCGLVVHPDAPWLGAVPDGLVYDPEENPCFGLVHIKFISLQSLSECRFLVCRKGALQVKTNHSYYWHIQGEMMVTGTSWCDLLVFSRQDLLVQRIYRDSATINFMKKKLHDFFFCQYLPSLVSD